MMLYCLIIDQASCRSRELTRHDQTGQTHLLRGAFRSVLIVHMLPLLAIRPKAASKVSMNFTNGSTLGLLLLQSGCLCQQYLHAQALVSTFRLRRSINLTFTQRNSGPIMVTSSTRSINRGSRVAISPD